MALGLRISGVCGSTRARTGVLETAHGAIRTPAFMPVGTQGTVKTLTPADLRYIGADVILGNTYHLYLRPGVDTVEAMGGLHRFIAWDGPILTDSGGFQVFSLAGLRKVTDGGVLFSSHIDGSEQFFSPELVVKTQERLGSDIAMVLDVCHHHDLGDKGTIEALELTHRWAVRCFEAHSKADQLLFAIVQGGASDELRRKSAEFLTGVGFPGYAVGGLSVGEAKEITWRILEVTTGLLPEDKPRYLMGVGAPDDIVRGVALGVDMFDSVLPTRLGRHGSVFTMKGRLNLRNSGYQRDDKPIDAECDCYTCRTFTKAYLHHLFRCEELVAYRLATLHNLRFMARLMDDIRGALNAGQFDAYRKEFLAGYLPSDERVRLEQKRRWLVSKGAAGQSVS